MSILALIHPTDLLADELREGLDRRRELWRELRLLSTREEEVGVLTEVRGAAAMVQELTDDRLAGSTWRSSAARWPTTGRCSSGCRRRPRRWCSPPTRSRATATRWSPASTSRPRSATVLPCSPPTRGRWPSPTSSIPCGLSRRATATLIEPVSTCGKAGLDEMFDQTRGILAFQTDPPREAFPAQMTFNLLPVAAPGAAMATHLATVLGSELEISIHALRVGVFHCYSISLHLELGEDPGVEAVAEALAERPLCDPAPDPELLGPIDAAARDEVLIGPIERDPSRPGAYRLWAVMDNLTCGGARNALAIMEAISLQVTH